VSERVRVTVDFDEIKLEFEQLVQYPFRAAVGFGRATDQERTSKQMFRNCIETLNDGSLRRNRRRGKIEKGQKLVVKWGKVWR
jgi:hypothetical protein